jgi:hypothetical protein
MFRAGVQSRGVSQRLTDAKPKDCNERRIHPQPVYITETAPPNLVKGAIGALLGSLIGGAIWGGICIGTENGGGGYATIGVGALVGIGASKFAGGKSAMLGVIAALFSIFGVLSGKYIFVAHDMLSFEEQFEEQVMQSNSLWVSVPESQRSLFLAKATTEFEKLHGAKPKDIGFFSVGPVTKMMFRPESEIFDGLDILFAIFALGWAWFYANEDSVVAES